MTSASSQTTPSTRAEIGLLCLSPKSPFSLRELIFPGDSLIRQAREPSKKKKYVKGFVKISVPKQIRHPAEEAVVRSVTSKKDHLFLQRVVP